ncbi:hypothetical protein [Dactylosporangium aurantiacum]|uniref:hypothetical protein n=1 Tax=Dactylosporangium aurantiacum TaxID=35754 RepID=UPI000524CC97|nr:hypothetical protein [Dactylosporangium aurantiacum]MDG6108613.1 hypothetical protein [Dactylosporangium aurantiacum]
MPDSVLDGLAVNPALPDRLIRRVIELRLDSRWVTQRTAPSADLADAVIATGDHRLLHALALNRGLPHDIRLRLARNPDDGVRAALVIGGRDGDPDLFARLIDDPSAQVRRYLAEGDNVPAGLRARLAHDPDPEVRATLARWWPAAPEHVRRVLLTDAADTVRAAACATYYARLPHPVPPADLLPALLDDPVTRAGAVRHAALTPALAARLAEDPDEEVRRELAGHPHLPPELRERLTEDPNPRVRVGVFARPDTPEPARAAVVAGIRVVDPLADLDDDGLEHMFADLELRTLRLAWVTDDPLPHVSSPYPCFRASAARSPALPPQAVARLLADEVSDVAAAALSRAPHLADVATAARIDREFRPVKHSRWRPADCYPFPPDALRRFAADPDPRMRQLAVRDPDLPVALAERLAADPDPSVRKAVADHPRLPVGTLRAMLRDPVPWVAGAAAAVPALPVGDLERLLHAASPRR